MRGATLQCVKKLGGKWIFPTYSPAGSFLSCLIGSGSIPVVTRCVDWCDAVDDIFDSENEK
jgi:hypothetical protein